MKLNSLTTITMTFVVLVLLNLNVSAQDTTEVIVDPNCIELVHYKDSIILQRDEDFEYIQEKRRVNLFVAIGASMIAYVLIFYYML